MISANPIGISHCQTLMYLIDITEILGLERLTEIADIANKAKGLCHGRRGVCAVTRVPRLFFLTELNEMFINRWTNKLPLWFRPRVRGHLGGPCFL